MPGLNAAFVDVGYEKDAFHKEARKGDIRNSRLDNNKLLKNTSWKPEYTLDQGLKEYLDK